MTLRRRRRYIATRRAYVPRLWPLLLLSATTAEAAYQIFPWSSLVLPLTVLFGVGIVIIRWRVWKWRHPKISFEEFMNDIRSKAMWN